MKKIIGLCLIVGVSLALIAAGCEGPSQKKPAARKGAVKMRGSKTLVIVAKSYIASPVLFVSLDRGRVLTMPKQIAGKPIDADLWVKPYMPEIEGLSASYDKFNVVLTQEIKISPVSMKYEEITMLPAALKWGKVLNKNMIKTGTVFVVRSGRGLYYKVRIDSMKTTPDVKAEDSFITITYAQIPEFPAK